MNSLQEHATLCTLNNAMVVRTCDGDNLRHAERIEVGFVSTLELGWVINRSDPNNYTLTGHKSRYRLHCANGSWVSN